MPVKKLKIGDRVLVTGGCGFIGSNLAKELFKQGYLVDIVDDLSTGNLTSLKDTPYQIVENRNKRVDNKINVFISNFDDERFMATAIANGDYVVVFHLAAIPSVSYSVEHPSKTNDANVSSTVRLFEACRNNVSRIVFSSSSAVYGNCTYLPINEDEKHKPLSPYALQKSIVESYARLFCELYYCTDIICLRYFNVFGQGQQGNSSYSTAISAWCDAIKNAKSLRSDGNGDQTRDMCHVDNVVHANIQAAIADNYFFGKAYNIACGESVSNNEILNFLKGRYNNLTIVNTPERKGDVKHTLANICLAQSELKYEVKVNFWEGLEKTLTWWGI